MYVLHNYINQENDVQLKLIAVTSTELMESHYKLKTSTFHEMLISGGYVYWIVDGTDSFINMISSTNNFDDYVIFIIANNELLEYLTNQILLSVDNKYLITINDEDGFNAVLNSTSKELNSMIRSRVLTLDVEISYKKHLTKNEPNSDIKPVSAIEFKTKGSQ